MIVYKANNQAPVSDVNLIAFGDQERARPVVIGGHRLGQEVRKGPRIVAPPYQNKTAVATATSLQAGANVAVNAAALNAPNKFVVVSGLTYCVGLVPDAGTGAASRPRSRLISTATMTVPRRGAKYHTDWAQAAVQSAL